jgi:MerR family transcriptional regulator/heat shock protein HspR
VEIAADNPTGDTDRTSANTDEPHVTAGDPPRRARRGPSRTQAVYVISVAAELAGMHPQTLRIYERRGLVNPARTKGGNRRYSDADIAILHRIAELTDAGMNLEGIRRIMALEVENRRLRAELEQAREIALHAISEADRRQSGGDLVPVRQALAVYGRRP